MIHHAHHHSAATRSKTGRQCRHSDPARPGAQSLAHHRLYLPSPPNKPQATNLDPWPSPPGLLMPRPKKKFYHWRQRSQKESHPCSASTLVLLHTPPLGTPHPLRPHELTLESLPLVFMSALSSIAPDVQACEFSTVLVIFPSQALVCLDAIPHLGVDAAPMLPHPRCEGEDTRLRVPARYKTPSVA